MQKLLILTSHDEGFDFEYHDFLEQLGQHYQLHIAVTPEYQGSLLTLDATIHRLKCRSKLDFKAIKQVRNLIRENGIDIIHTQTNRLLAIATLSCWWLKDTPAIFCRRGICAPVYRYRLEDLLTYFSKRLTHVITISHAAKQSLIDCGYPADKVTAIHQGVNPERFSKSVDKTKFRAEHNIPQDALVVMCIANKRHVKGLDRIFEAADRLADENIYWCLIGWGCDQRLLDDLKREKPDKVRLLSFMEDAYQYLPAADIYVQPSRMEGFSYSLLQAMIKGCCPIISNTGGMVELVEHKQNGLVFPNDDQFAADQLIKHIITVSNNTDLRNQYAANSYAKVSELFSIELMVAQTLKVYQRYVPSKK